jgi:hypothetical protein
MECVKRCLAVDLVDFRFELKRKRVQEGDNDQEMRVDEERRMRLVVMRWIWTLWAISRGIV